MDTKILTTSMVGTILQPGNDSSSMAQQLSGLFDEGSMSKAIETFEEVKSLMSCYQCAILEVETKFKVLNERFSVNH